MIVKIKDKEYSFDGYAQPLQSIQQLAEECYEQGRAEAIESAYYVIKPFMSIEEWKSEVNYQIGLKEKKNE